jgi:hypothetical protein
MSSDAGRSLLRHTVATLAYRGGKALRGAPASFSEFRASEGTRTPGQILAHLNDLLAWALQLAEGRHVWEESTPGAWEQDVATFHAGLERLDTRLTSAEPLGCPPEKLFQGPIADALTHVGQIAMLRRMAGAPMRGENYFKADIQAGRVGAAQPPSRVEFD